MSSDGCRRDWGKRIKEVSINFPEVKPEDKKEAKEKDQEDVKILDKIVKKIWDNEKKEFKYEECKLKNKPICDAIIDLIYFINKKYDEYKILDENVFGKILMDSGIKGKQDALKTEEMFERIAGRALEGDKVFESSVKKVIVEVIKKRDVKGDMAAKVKRWAKDRKLKIDPKEVADAIISINKNGRITESVKEQLLLKILAKRNQKDLEEIKWEIEYGDRTNKRSEDLQNEIKILMDHRLILGREGVTLDILEKRLELDIERTKKIIEDVKNNGNSQDEKLMNKIEKRLIDRTLLLEKITKTHIDFEKAYMSWVDLEGSDLFTEFFLDELQNKMKQMSAFGEALKNDVLVLEEMFNEIEDGKSLKTLLLKKELPEKISHLEAVIKAIENGEIVCKDSITEEMRDTIRQLFINWSMVDNGEVNSYSVGALMLKVLDYKSISSSFMTWLNKSENELKYIEESIKSVVYSELILPDIIGQLCLDILKKPYHDEVYAKTGKLDDVYVLKLRRIGDNKHEIDFWKEKGFEVKEDIIEDSEEKKVKKGIAGHIFKMNSFLLPYMNIFKGNQIELQKTILYGTKGKQEYCSIVDNVLKSTNNFLKDLGKEYEEQGMQSPIDCGFRRVVNDMFVNELVGHRYVTDLGEFIINLGNKEDCLYGKNVLEIITASQIKQQVVVKTKGGEIFFWDMDFIEKCVSLPEYWQSIFWGILKVYLKELFSSFISTVCNEMELDKDYLMKCCQIPADELVRFLGNRLWIISNEMCTVFGDKVDLIRFVIEENEVWEKLANGFEEIIMKIESKDLFSPVTRKIWENMVDYTYYDEKTRRNKYFEILRNVKGKKSKGNRFSQRKTGELFDRIGETYLNTNRIHRT